MNYDHAPGAESIAQPVDLQSSLLLLCYWYPLYQTVNASCLIIQCGQAGTKNLEETMACLMFISSQSARLAAIIPVCTLLTLVYIADTSNIHPVQCRVELLPSDMETADLCNISCNSPDGTGHTGVFKLHQKISTK